MAKIAGKLLQFWFDSKEIPISSLGYDVNFNEIDTTDSSTSGDGTESIIGRATRKGKIEAMLDSGDGAELATGTLTAGTKYRVTLGTITEGSSSYAVGKIFTSAGTGTASSSNKVVPLGSKVDGKTMALTVGGTSYPVTTANYNVSYTDIDTTDSSTSANDTESIVGRATRKTKAECFVNSTAADMMAATLPAAAATTLTLATGVTISGQAIPIAKSISDSVKDAAKVSYDLNWIGAPTETKIPFALGVQKAFKMILQTGTSTNKEYTGNALFTSRDISSSVKDGGKVSLNMSIVGGVTENVAN